MREADFSERIKTVLCERVGGRCSNPKCRRETLGPHKKVDKRLSIGQALHIFMLHRRMALGMIRG